MEDISIIIADAQFLIRVGLKHVIAERDDFLLLHEVAEESELINHIKKRPPKVVILDYNQGGNFNIKTISKIKETAAETNILIISADEDKQNIYKVLEKGVNSFLTKQCEATEIVNAIYATAKGQRFFCSSVLEHILEKSFGKKDTAPSIPLTPREIEIVRMIVDGKIAKQIADELCLSTHTVYTHRKKIMKKLGLNSPSELIIYAMQNKLVN